MVLAYAESRSGPLPEVGSPADDSALIPSCFDHVAEDQFKRKEAFTNMRNKLFALTAVMCMLAVFLPVGPSSWAMEDIAVSRTEQEDAQKKVERARKAEQKGRIVRGKAQQALEKSKKKIEQGAKKITDTGEEAAKIGKGVTKETGKKLLQPVKKMLQKGADKLKGGDKKPAPPGK
jgi:hypothetical protein